MDDCLTHHRACRLGDWLTAWLSTGHVVLVTGWLLDSPQGMSSSWLADCLTLHRGLLLGHVVLVTGWLLDSPQGFVVGACRLGDWLTAWLSAGVCCWGMSSWWLADCLTLRRGLLWGHVVLVTGWLLDSPQGFVVGACRLGDWLTAWLSAGVCCWGMSSWWLADCLTVRRGLLWGHVVLVTGWLLDSPQGFVVGACRLGDWLTAWLSTGVCWGMSSWWLADCLTLHRGLLWGHVILVIGWQLDSPQGFVVGACHLGNWLTAWLAYNHIWDVGSQY